MFRRIQMLWIYRAHQLLLTESKGGDGRSQSQTKNLSRSNERPQSAEVTQAHSMTRGFHHQITLVGRCYCYTYKRILKLARHQQANRFGGSMLQNLVRVFFFLLLQVYILALHSFMPLFCCYKQTQVNASTKNFLGHVIFSKFVYLRTPKTRDFLGDVALKTIKLHVAIVEEIKRTSWVIILHKFCAASVWLSSKISPFYRSPQLKPTSCN